MKITFDKEGLKRLLSRTKATASGVGEAAKTGATLVGHKTEDALLYAKLMRRVRDLEKEIDLQLAEIGALIYATHTGNPSDSQDIQEILEYIDSLYEEIDGHERQIKIMHGILFCDACGEENAATNVYCQECGQILSRE